MAAKPRPLSSTFEAAPVQVAGETPAFDGAYVATPVAAATPEAEPEPATAHDWKPDEAAATGVEAAATGLEPQPEAPPAGATGAPGAPEADAAQLVETDW